MPRAAAFATLLLLPLAACSTRDPFSNPFQDPRPGWATVPVEPGAPWGLAMFDGTRGTVLTWHDLSQAVAWADVVVIGEQHDDPVAHQVQQAIVAESMARFPRTAVALEMLERPEQAQVDAYLRGELTVDEFVDATGSRNWAGKDSWMTFYQPVLDSARDTQSRVVAANAPRPLVRRARTEGYESLLILPLEERAQVDLPQHPGSAEYRRRFDEVMRGNSGDDAPSQEALDRTWRSQRVWDATMARSVMRSRDTAIQQPGGAQAARKVILLVGQFHSDFDGGVVSEMSAYDPLAKILVISIQRRNADVLDPSDYGRAAIVVYSGETPPAADAETTDPQAG